VLVDEVRQGQLPPGTKLPSEASLVQRFRVSRTVVREALSRLKSLGLVDSHQGSGVYVRPAAPAALNFDERSTESLEAVVQMAELRRPLEAEVAALAARRRSAHDIRRLQRALRAVDAAVLAGRDGVDEDVDFHRAVADAAGNPYLSSTLDFLSQFLHGATRVTRANEARRADFARQVRDEHAAITRAIKAGDPAAARRAAARHMNNAIARIHKAAPAFWAQQGVALATPLVRSRPRRAKLGAQAEG
jgi:GntR family transcriptional repressor for pyruvate dehydrogenase complex